MTTVDPDQDPAANALTLLEDAGLYRSPRHGYPLNRGGDLPIHPLRVIRHALKDPSRITPRKDRDTLKSWQARAIFWALIEAGHIPEPTPPTGASIRAYQDADDANQETPS